MSVFDRLLHVAPRRGISVEIAVPRLRLLAAALLSVTVAVSASAQGLASGVAPGVAQAPTQSAQSISMPDAGAAAEPTQGQYPEPTPGAAKHLVSDPAFAAYPQYRGSLDGRAIVLRIGEKSRTQQSDDDAEPGHLNGEYQYLPNGPVVLIAGSRDGNTLTLEESDDGTRISGQWVGFFAADGRLSGERMNNDESDPVPVALHSALHAVAAPGRRALAPADVSSNAPTHAPSQGRP